MAIVPPERRETPIMESLVTVRDSRTTYRQGAAVRDGSRRLIAACKGEEVFRAELRRRRP